MASTPSSGVRPPGRAIGLGGVRRDGRAAANSAGGGRGARRRERRGERAERRRERPAAPRGVAERERRGTGRRGRRRQAPGQPGASKRDMMEIARASESSSSRACDELSPKQVSQHLCSTVTTIPVSVSHSSSLSPNAWSQPALAILSTAPRASLAGAPRRARRAPPRVDAPARRLRDAARRERSPHSATAKAPGERQVRPERRRRRAVPPAAARVVERRLAAHVPRQRPPPGASNPSRSSAAPPPRGNPRGATRGRTPGRRRRPDARGSLVRRAVVLGGARVRGEEAHVGDRARGRRTPPRASGGRIRLRRVGRRLPPLAAHAAATTVSAAGSRSTHAAPPRRVPPGSCTREARRGGSP